MIATLLVSVLRMVVLSLTLPVSFNRKVRRKIVLSDGLTIPAGTFICTSAYWTARDAEVFEGGESFVPWRWLELREAAGVFVIFLGCRPLSTNWGVPHQCRPSYRTSISVAVCNTIADFVILILPQPMIWQLQLPRMKKLALSVVFLMGILSV